MNNVINILTTQGATLRQDAVSAEMEKFGFNYRFIKGIETNNNRFSDIHTDFFTLLRSDLDNDYFIYAEDDCEFTAGFSADKLKRLIDWGINNKIDVLTTGSFAIGDIELIPPDLLSIYFMMGAQLIVIFKESYQKILAKEAFKGPIDMMFQGLKIVCPIPFLTLQTDRKAEFNLTEARLKAKYNLL